MCLLELPVTYVRIRKDNPGNQVRTHVLSWSGMPVYGNLMPNGRVSCKRTEYGTPLV
jgi:hypothetical protein